MIKKSNETYGRKNLFEGNRKTKFACYIAIKLLYSHWSKQFNHITLVFLQAINSPVKISCSGKFTVTAEISVILTAAER